jgi:Leucine-rich repeat (LRR) protein
MSELQVKEELEQLLKAEPYLDRLDLSNSQLKSVVPLLSTVMKFRNLKEINLKGNKLKDFPSLFETTG